MDYCCLRKRQKQHCNKCTTGLEKHFLHLLYLHIYKLDICVNISYNYVVYVCLCVCVCILGGWGVMLLLSC